MLSDQALLERAKSAANGEKFDRLWGGNTAGYESHSEADMALCSLLAFWTGGDSRQLDRLFRESGLMGEKWHERYFADGSTYGEKTPDQLDRRSLVGVLVSLLFRADDLVFVAGPIASGWAESVISIATIPARKNSSVSAT